jgi:hypothetical protein
LKCVSNIVWETLSRGRNVNEKLAWEDEVQSEDHYIRSRETGLLREQSDVGEIKSLES